MIRIFYFLYIFLFIISENFYSQNKLLSISPSVILYNQNYYYGLRFSYENKLEPSLSFNTVIGIINVYTNFGIFTEFIGKMYFNTNKIDGLYFASGFGLDFHYMNTFIFNIIPDHVLPYFIINLGYRILFNLFYIKNIYIEPYIGINLWIILINNFDNDFHFGIDFGKLL